MGSGPDPEADGERVAVLLCGYGEVESNEDLAEYNAKSLRLLVSKSVPIPDVAVPFLSRRLARKAREEYERANRFVSPHNAIFERQRAGIAAALARAVRRPRRGVQRAQLLRRATCRRTSCR